MCKYNRSQFGVFSFLCQDDATNKVKAYSINKLVEILGLSHNTIRKAIKIFKEVGYYSPF